MLLTTLIETYINKNIKITTNNQRAVCMNWKICKNSHIIKH